MGFKTLQFPNREGQLLSARLELPMDEKPQAFAIFAHCFRCSKNLKALVHTSRALTLSGIAVLRFDFTGLGESEGEFAQTTFTTNVTDIATAADYLVAAPGSCTSMTLRMVADRKKWPLEKVMVRLKHRKIHAEDCRECETKEGKIDRNEREIEPCGPLTDEQREKLLEIADKCPVHRTLSSEIIIESELRGSTS